MAVFVIDPSSTKNGTCTACGAALVWARLVTTHTWHPFDAATVKAAPAALDLFDQAQQSRRVEAVSHFATCPNADRFRRGTR